jgi:hypothetical protein
VNLQARVTAAFATVYVIWDSTYLAIRFVIETLSLQNVLAAGIILTSVAVITMYATQQKSPEEIRNKE